MKETTAVSVAKDAMKKEYPESTPGKDPSTEKNSISTRQDPQQSQKQMVEL